MEKLAISRGTNREFTVSVS